MNSWDRDVTAPEPFEPDDSWSGGAGEDLGELTEDNRPYRADPNRPHPTDCDCGQPCAQPPKPLSWWTHPRRPR